MSAFLTLASDYIERMTNPTYGIGTNEDYSIRFAQLLKSEGFEFQLKKEIESLTDPAALSSFGWMWVFEWSKALNLTLQEDLLFHHFFSWSSPFIRAEIINLGIRNSEITNYWNYSIEEFPSPFLRKIMNEVIYEDRQKEYHEKNIKFPKDISKGTTAASVLVSFLQEGSKLSLAASSVLLKHRWEGQGRLLELFWSILKNLDSETQDVWKVALEPPEL